VNDKLTLEILKELWDRWFVVYDRSRGDLPDRFLAYGDDERVGVVDRIQKRYNGFRLKLVGNDEWFDVDDNAKIAIIDKPKFDLKIRLDPFKYENEYAIRWQARFGINPFPKRPAPPTIS